MSYNMSGMAQALPQVTYPATAPKGGPIAGRYLQLASHSSSMASRQQLENAINPSSSTPSALGATYSHQPQMVPAHRQHDGLDLDTLVYTDQHSIHISRLPHDTTQRNLQKLLSRSGTVLDISIKRGKEKRCSATAHYKTSAEAAQAIRELNGTKMGKMTLVVRYDRSEAGSASSAPSSTSKSSDSDSPSYRVSSKQTQSRTGPLVVDGAGGPGYHKRCEDDDDSESIADSSGDDENTRGTLSVSHYAQDCVC